CERQSPTLWKNSCYPRGGVGSSRGGNPAHGGQHKEKVRESFWRQEVQLKDKNGNKTANALTARVPRSIRRLTLAEFTLLGSDLFVLRTSPPPWSHRDDEIHAGSPQMAGSETTAGFTVLRLREWSGSVRSVCGMEIKVARGYEQPPTESPYWRRCSVPIVLRNVRSRPRYFSPN